MAKEYTKLNKFEEYDREAAEELAEALTEIRELNARVEELTELVSENPELHDFVWTTSEGKTLALHNIPDDHFKNILQHLVNNGRPIKKSIRAETRRRGIMIPTVYQRISLSQRTAIEAGTPDDPINLDDIPF